MNEKKAFVENELQACLKAAYPEIDWLEYEHDEKTGQEFVHVHYLNGVRYSANVTIDSLSAIIKDVLKQVVWVHE